MGLTTFETRHKTREKSVASANPLAPSLSPRHHSSRCQYGVCRPGLRVLRRFSRVSHRVPMRGFRRQSAMRAENHLSYVHPRHTGAKSARADFAVDHVLRDSQDANGKINAKMESILPPLHQNRRPPAPRKHSRAKRSGRGRNKRHDQVVLSSLRARALRMNSQEQRELEHGGVEEIRADPAASAPRQSPVDRGRR